MRVGNGLRVAIARAGAGVAAAVGMAAAAVSPVEVAAPAGGPSAAEIEAIEATTGMPLPVATGPDGQPLPAVVGDPPDVEPAVPAEEFLERAERAAAAAEAAPSSSGRARPGEPDPAAPVVDDATLLVSFEDGTAPDAALDEAGVTGTPVEGTNTVVVDLAGADRAAVESALADAPGVALVEPHLVRTVERLPNDSGRAAQDPYLTTVGLPAAWDVADTGAKATVAVLDSGVDLDHPDLAPNLVAGYNALAPAATPQDDYGHGTAVAGIIGAATNNAAGIAGVAWNARIMPVKVLDSTGRGTDARIATGIRWAVDHGADIVNLSLGGPGASTLLQDAIDYALARDVVVVAAAGNDGAPIPHYPAAFPGVVSVGATDSSGRAAWFSNHGPWVMLAAPGIAVRTTGRATGAVHTTTDGTGTSFSSPIVAGVAALLVERHPSWTWDTVVWQLLRTSRDAGPAGADDAYGYGVVDAAAALGVGPIAPTSLPPTAGDAGNLPVAPRTIATGAAVTETIGYESDEDWLAFDVPQVSGATVTVTPPAEQVTGTRAAEMDPMVELYGPGGGLVAAADNTLTGEPETVTLDLAPGRHLLRVRNYHPSTSPSPYTTRVTLTEVPPSPTGWLPAAEVFDTDDIEEGVVVADISGDGRDDVVLTAIDTTGEPNGEGLQYFVQQADGTLAAPTFIPVDDFGYGPAVRPTAGDLDGDDDIDVAVPTARGLRVAWNDGGDLGDPVLLPFGALTTAEPGDLDGDGVPELAVAGPSGTAVVHWTGSELALVTGDAAPPAGFFTAELPADAFGVGDLTGDGRPDITVVRAGVVVILPQQASGSWGPEVTRSLPAGMGPGRPSLAVGDTTGDGRADLAVIAQGSDSTSRFVRFVQQPDGSLAPPDEETLTSYNEWHSMEIADVTGDGRDDVVALGYAWQATKVFEQAPGGGLLPERSVPTPNNSVHFGIGDLDGDGFNDLAIINQGLVVMRHSRGAPAPETTSPWFTAVTPPPHSTTFSPTTTYLRVDLGRDVGSHQFDDDNVCLLHGRGGGCVPLDVLSSLDTLYIDPVVPLQPGTPYQLVVGGATDSTGRPVYGAFPFVTAGTPGPTTPNVGGIYWPFRWDAAGDGYDDIVWFDPSAGGDPVWLFGPNGRVGTSTSVQGTFTPLAGDFDGNGYEDVFWYAPGTAADVMWLDGPTGITTRTLPVNGTYVPLVGDFDRNGFDDIFWYGPGAAAESVWRFRAGGQFTSVAERAVTTTGYRIVAGDFNRDGHDDVLWHMPGTGGESVWRGGTGAFTPVAAPAANGSYNLRSGDSDGDGFDDVYLFGAGASTLWRGTTTGFASKAAPIVPTTARPIVGDFGADGRDDLLAYVPGATADPLYPGRSGGW